MSEKKDAILSVRDLDVIYTSDKKIVHAVNGVSFDLEKGKTLGLVGETGAGKTTIARAILGILPNPPSKLRAGEIFFEGTDLLALKENEMLKIRGEKIAMIFLDPMTALNPLMTVGDQIAEGILQHSDLKKNESKEKAEEMLEMVGIPRGRYDEYPFEFSGGMKQRVVIAMALACNPELLLADEPTTALDVTIQAQILDLINTLKQDYGMSMVLITHDLGVVAQTCDHVAVIYSGQIVEYGSREDIFLRAKHPYTHGLFDSLPSMNGESDRLTPIKGMPPDPTNLPQGCSFGPRCPYYTEACGETMPELTEIEPGHFCRCSGFEEVGKCRT
ncbi:MAG: ABC transporter ATP-binding protein [Lachnospiraceae bacterium]|nr:ABC transporter ATP-binding protein [Lachnospiraceae bacterium]